MLSAEDLVAEINEGMGVIIMRVISDVIVTGDYIPYTVCRQISQLIPDSRVISLEPSIILSVTTEIGNMIITYNKELARFE